MGIRNGAWISLHTTSTCSDDSTMIGRYTFSSGSSASQTFTLTQSPSSSSSTTTKCYTCDKCQPGTYESNACISTTNTQCQECSGGKYQDQEDQQHCNDCSTGQYSLTGATSCISCTEGTYQDTEGQASCKPCPDGQYQDAEGQASCKTCMGEPSVDKKSCDLECGQGSYDRDQTCVDCEAGFYSNITKAIAIETTNTNCNNIRIKLVTSPVNSIRILKADGSTAYDANGNNMNSLGYNRYCLPYGNYKFESRRASSSSYGDSNCYSSTESEVRLLLYRPDGALKATITNEHPSQTYCGTYLSSSFSITDQLVKTFSSPCTACEVGRFQNQTGQASCTDCDPGKYQDQTSQISCLTCPIGKNSMAGATGVHRVQTVLDLSMGSVKIVQPVVMCITAFVPIVARENIKTKPDKKPAYHAQKIRLATHRQA